MVLVAAYGGLRFGELTALTKADLLLDDPDRPAVVVRRTMTRLDGRWLEGTPKTDAGLRTVTLPRFLHPLLEDHLNHYVRGGPDALVFATASGRPLARSNWTATFHRATHEIGLDDIHFHDLRHAAATAAVQTGATLKDTMARLGHASPRAALIYQHTAQHRDHAIAAALNTAATEAQKTQITPKTPAHES
jgi:integrase